MTHFFFLSSTSIFSSSVPTYLLNRSTAFCKACSPKLSAQQSPEYLVVRVSVAAPQPSKAHCLGYRAKMGTWVLGNE